MKLLPGVSSIGVTDFAALSIARASRPGFRPTAHLGRVDGMGRDEVKRWRCLCEVGGRGRGVSILRVRVCIWRELARMRTPGGSVHRVRGWGATFGPAFRSRRLSNPRGGRVSAASGSPVASRCAAEESRESILASVERLPVRAPAAFAGTRQRVIACRPSELLKRIALRAPGRTPGCAKRAASTFRRPWCHESRPVRVSAV